MTKMQKIRVKNKSSPISSMYFNIEEILLQ